MSNLTIFVVLFTFSASFFTCSTKNPSQHNSDEGENSTKKDEIKNIQNYASDVVKDEKHLHELALYAIEWAHNNGLVMLSEQEDIAEFAPISLFPSPFPRKAFEKALAVQKDMNLLYFRVASDNEFMVEAFKDLIPGDAHIAKLWQIVQEVREEGIRQPFTLLIQRADYMLNVVEDPKAGEEQYEIKQVEVNGGAISGLGMKRRNSELHRQMLRKVGMDISASPVNQPDFALVEALHMAWKQFGDSNALLMFLTPPKISYVFEQRHIASELERVSNGKIEVIFVSLFGTAKILHLDPEDFSLRRNSDGRRVAVVYSNMSPLGYRPSSNYDMQMEARKMIERSTAIKAPSLAIGISCTKKIQQLLTKPENLKRFFPRPEDAETIENIRSTFAGLWGLENDDQQTQELIKDAMENPSNYVLKPNRECGGNNYFDEQIPEAFQKFTPEERAAHILMQKLRPMAVQNYLLRPLKEPKESSVVPELGVYGFLLGNMVDGSVQHNVQQGYHFRSKLAHLNEGGISAGFGYYDTAYLF
uniref:Glutathione synthetase n=1 Tax=Globodera rostochiensis TaxID=31243 RepID=A0A914I0K1_GLORO